MATALLSRLHALSPFGPIFAKELRTTARRKRSYLLRVFYLGGLLLALMMGYVASGDMFGGSGRGVAAQAMAQAELGASFFVFFAFFCLAAMAVIGPVLTSTAVSSEKLAKTFPVLLMTPINTWQIVGGKLFSRLLVALTLIGLSLPVLALVRLLGGVELWQMLAAVSLCACTALFTASVGLFFSTFINRAYAAILLSYLALFVIYVFIPFVIGAVMSALAMNANAMGPPPWFMTVMRLIAAINPGVSMGTIVMPPNMIFSATWVPCVLTHLGATALMVFLSAMIVRRVVRRSGEQSFAAAPPEYLPPRQTGFPMQAAPAAGAATAGGAAPPPLPSFAAPAPLPAPAPTARARRRSDVGDNPVLWREVRRPLLSKSWQKVLAIWGTLVLLCGSYALFGINEVLDDAELQMMYVCVFNAFIWVLAAVLSATAIAQEKEGDTWTLLLSTPVSGSAIVWGKVLGLCRRMLWPYLLVAAHFCIFALADVVSCWTVVLVLWVIASFNTVWIATGVFLSLWLRKVTLAVILNLILAVLAYLGVLVVLEILGEIPTLAREIVYGAALAAAVLVLMVLLARSAWRMYRERPRWAPRLPGVAALTVLLLLAAVPLGRIAIHLLGGSIKWEGWDTASYVDPFDARNHYSRNLSEHVGWYAPYFHLVQWIDWERRYSDGWGTGTLDLPASDGVPPATYLGVVFFLGCLHVFAAWLLLTVISIRFDAIVGRAPQGRGSGGAGMHAPAPAGSV